jgi:hypothetical protein
MRTTIDLPDELFSQVKARAAEESIRLKELIRRYVEQGLRDGAPPSGPAPHRRRSELPTIRTAAGRKLPDFTNADLYAILEREEVEAARGRLD